MWLAPATIMLGSLVTILPFVASVALLPPFGLLMLLGWRMQRPDALRPWAAVLLGLFDDLVSGQPLGSAMLLWTSCFIAIDILDTRLVWRDFWQDWLIATGAIGFCLIAGRLVATSFGAHVDTVLLLQIIISAALYPLIARLCARLDREKAT
jgi:rod shape-determining protein MreD